ncbi:hypothetical protein [Lacisediminimonas sp.]|uniref:hypothetical protein n=1 Tax=Lacisediminimonas sp. TaxID=3060582 RepID=UPI0027237A68|nr:hypothetical protein [Lacisediminimonas sp.]MDO8298214.1 hypothetical protein [Lacisediminimonas sp.]
MINYIVMGQDRRVTLAVLQAVRSFTDAGCMVIGTERNRGLRWSSLCKQQATIRFDGADDDAFVTLLDHLSRRNRHLVLIPTDCDAIGMVNRVGERLAVTVAPIPDTATMTMLDDRWQFQQLCRRHSLPAPASRLIGGDTQPDFASLATELGLPFLVKPVSQRHSGGKLLIRCRSDLLRMPAHTLLIAQQIVAGIDASISLLADRGQPTAFAIAGLDPGQSARFHPELERLAARLCQVSAFNGMMRLRARVDVATGEAVLIDCVPHCWPGLTASILAGLNLVAESVQPSPRRSGMPRITQATTVLGHPLAPARWQRLCTADEGGRLLRAISLDMYSLSMSTASVVRHAWRHTSSNTSLRPAPALPARAQDASARLQPVPVTSQYTSATR